MHAGFAAITNTTEGAPMRRKQARWYRTSRMTPAHRHHHRPTRMHYVTWS